MSDPTLSLPSTSVGSPPARSRTPLFYSDVACPSATRLAAGTRSGHREAQEFANIESTDAGGVPHSPPAEARALDTDAETLTMDDHLALHPEDGLCPECNAEDWLGGAACPRCWGDLRRGEDCPGCGGRGCGFDAPGCRCGRQVTT